MPDTTDNPYSLQHGSHENVRLDAQHEALTSLIGGKTFQAPVESPSKILDIGCGSGIATVFLARRFPSAQVIGIDLAPVIQQPSFPPNVKFLQGNFSNLVETGALQANDFDYIFQRMLVLGVIDWQSHTNLAARLLKPGGWLEMQDLSWALYDRDGKRLEERYAYIRAIQESSTALGLDPFCGEHLGGYMHSAGLQDISHTNFPFAWVYWRDKPETEKLAAHNRSAAHFAARVAVLDNLVGGTGKYSQRQIEEFKEEHERSYEQAEEGTHYVYGVAFGRKVSSSS